MGGTKADEFRVFDRQAPHTAQSELFQHKTDGTYSLDFSPASQEVVAAGAGNVISVLDVKSGAYREFAAVGFRNVPKW